MVALPLAVAQATVTVNVVALLPSLSTSCSSGVALPPFHTAVPACRPLIDGPFSQPLARPRLTVTLPSRTGGGGDTWVAVRLKMERLATASAADTGIQVTKPVALLLPLLMLSGALAFQVPIWALICTAVRATFHTRKSRIWP